MQFAPCIIYCVIFGNRTLVRYLALARCAIFIMHALLHGLRLRALFDGSNVASHFQALSIEGVTNSLRLRKWPDYVKP